MNSVLNPQSSHCAQNRACQDQCRQLATRGTGSMQVRLGKTEGCRWLHLYTGPPERMAAREAPGLRRFSTGVCSLAELAGTATAAVAAAGAATAAPAQSHPVCALIHAGTGGLRQSLHHANLLRFSRVFRGSAEGDIALPTQHDRMCAPKT